MTNPTKPNLKTEIFSIIVIIITMISSIYFYSIFPSNVPTHWNLNGEPDKWSPKAVGAFLFPAILLITYLVFLILPSIDPKKERYSEFRKTYHIFKTIIVSTLAILYFTTSLSSSGLIQIPIELIITSLIGIMLIVMGNYMSDLKPNWFIGIRTPWTLSSEEVWNKTHKIGKKIFITSGVVIILTQLLSPSFKMLFIILTVLSMSIGTIAYSYCAYKKENKKNRQK